MTTKKLPIQLKESDAKKYIFSEFDKWWIKNIKNSQKFEKRDIATIIQKLSKHALKFFLGKDSEFAILMVKEYVVDYVADKLIEQFDKNGDGTIDLEEALDGAFDIVEDIYLKTKACCLMCYK